MTPGHIGALRLRSQRIAGPRHAAPVDVVRWLGAVQAQDHGQALWAVGVRTERSTRRDVERAIEDKAILRTWPMRGTIHLVPAVDAHWMLKLGAARKLAGDRRRMEQLELDDAVVGRCAELLHAQLQGRGPVARAEVMQLLERAGIRTTGQRGYHLLWRLAQTGLVCLGPVRAKQQTFVLLDEWVPAPRRLARDEALAELAGRYFTSRGPATVHDFATWAGLTVADARAGLEAVRPSLACAVVAGVEHWLAPETIGASSGDTSSGHLLPGFDEFLLGYKDRSAVLAADHAARVVPGGNGVFFPIVLVAGRVVGTWKRRTADGPVDVALRPFDDRAQLTEQVAPAVRTYARFLGLPLAPAWA